jgi:hypothetical protein
MKAGKFATMGAIACFLLSTCVCSHDKEQGRKRLGAASEQFLPAQSLRLVDGKGEQFGGIVVHSDGVVTLSLDTSDGLPTWWYTTGANGSMMTLYGKDTNGHAFINVLIEPLPSFSLFLPDGHVVKTDSKAWNTGKSSSLALALVRAAYESLFPPKSEHTIDDQIPSEDARFIDKDGHVIFVCGLSENAEPSIAVVNVSGGLRAVLHIGELGEWKRGNSKEWPSLALFDRYGKLRFSVEAGENADPILTVFEETKSDSADLGIYTLDATNGQEIPVKHLFNNSEGRIPWLRAIPRVRLPIVLLDERNKILWKSGSS